MTDFSNPSLAPLHHSIRDTLEIFQKIIQTWSSTSTYHGVYSLLRCSVFLDQVEKQAVKYRQALQLTVDSGELYTSGIQDLLNVLGAESDNHSDQYDLKPHPNSTMVNVAAVLQLIEETDVVFEDAQETLMRAIDCCSSISQTMTATQRDDPTLSLLINDSTKLRSSFSRHNRASKLAQDFSSYFSHITGLCHSIVSLASPSGATLLAPLGSMIDKFISEIDHREAAEAKERENKALALRGAIHLIHQLFERCQGLDEDMQVLQNLGRKVNSLLHSAKEHLRNDIKRNGDISPFRPEINTWQEARDRFTRLNRVYLEYVFQIEHLLDSFPEYATTGTNSRKTTNLSYTPGELSALIAALGHHVDSDGQ